MNQYNKKDIILAIVIGINLGVYLATLFLKT